MYFLISRKVFNTDQYALNQVRSQLLFKLACCVKSPFLQISILIFTSSLIVIFHKPQYCLDAFDSFLIHYCNTISVVVIARCQVQYGKYFPSFSYFATYFEIIAKYEKRRKYLTILHEATCDNYFFVKCLFKSNES